MYEFDNGAGDMWAFGCTIVEVRPKFSIFVKVTLNGLSVGFGGNYLCLAECVRG